MQNSIYSWSACVFCIFAYYKDEMKSSFTLISRAGALWTLSNQNIKKLQLCILKLTFSPQARSIPHPISQSH